MAGLFISYSRKNIEAARKLTEAFKTQDLDFWIDWEGIPPTVDWWKEVENGIEEADIFLFLLSPDSCKSKVCKQEIEHAIKNGKRLIPLVVYDVKGEEVPAELSHLNWIFIRETDDLDLAFAKLITAIKTDYAWAQAHRDLQVKALDWEKSGHENSFLLFGKELQEAEHQLATNTSKEPYPTDLQREYVHKSRQAVDRRRVRNAGVTTAGLIALAVLAIFGFVQAGQATANAAEAQAASTLAVSHAETAQANAEEAQRQANIAEERERIARAGELAAQAVAQRDKQFDLSLLLSVEAFNTTDTLRTRSVLLESTQINPQLIGFLHGHNRKIFNVALDNDGKILISSGCYELDSFGNCAKVELIKWNLSTGKRADQPTFIKIPSVTNLAFSPDGNMMAAQDWDDILVWDMATLQFKGSLLGEAVEYPESNLAFSPDGKMLAWGKREGVISLWDVRTRKLIRQLLTGNIASVTSIAFSPDGNTLAAGNSDTSIVFIDMKTHEIINQSLTSNSFLVSSMVFSADGHILASGGCGEYSGDMCTKGTITLWDMKTMKPLDTTFTEYSGQVTSLAFSPDSKTLVSGSEDGTILLWELESRQPLAETLTGHNSQVTSGTFSPNGKRLAWADGDRIVIWNTENYLPVGQPLKLKGQVFSLAFSPDGKLLASNICGEADEYSCISNEIILWDVERSVSVGQPLVAPGRWVSNVTFSPDGRIVASGNDNTINLWDVETGQPIGEPLQGYISRYSSSLVESVAFSPDGKLLATGGGDGILIWNVETRQPIGQPLEGYAGTVLSIAFSPDGRTLATGSGADVILWNVTSSGQTITIGQPFSGHTDMVNSLSFSRDGKLLASASDDTTIILWNVETGQPLAQLFTGHSSRVTNVAFSPDGHQLASSSEDSTILIWNIDTEFWIEEICHRVGRNLTHGEWNQYFPNEKYRKTCAQWPNHPSYYQALAREILANLEDVHRVQTALDSIEIEMEKDSALQGASREASQIVMEEIQAQVSANINTSTLDLLVQAKDLRLDVSKLSDKDFLNYLCWDGSLQGYASQVLQYCEQAVQLDPDDPGVRDSRGLARALTNDFLGAIDDFQFYVDRADRDSSFIQQRQQWIIDLKAGKNPFTPDVLEQLRIP